MTDHGDVGEVKEVVVDDEETAPLKGSLHMDSVCGEKPCSKALAMVTYPFRFAYNSGTFCCIFASLLYSFVGVATKILSENIPVLQLLMIRSGFIVLTCFVAMRCQGIASILGPRKGWGMLAATSLLAFGGLVSWFVSCTLIPVGDAMALSKLAPIFAVIFSSIFHWEAVNLLMAFGALVCCIGGTIILRPPFLLGGHGQWDALQVLGDGLGFAAAIFFSLNYMFVGRIGIKLGVCSINFACHLTTLCLLSIPVSFSFPSPPVFQLALNDVFLLLLYLPVSVAATFFVTRGLQLCDGVQGSTLQTSGIIFSYMLGLIFLGEKVTLFAGIGTFVIVLGIWTVATGKARALRAQTEEGNVSYIHLATVDDENADAQSVTEKTVEP